MENNQGVASEYRSGSQGTTFIKGADFDSGLEVEVVGMEKFTPSNAEYGVKNTYGAGGVVIKENWFVKQGLLKEGESFKYKFKVGDVDKTFDNSSVGFYFAFTNKNPNAGDKIVIKRDKVSNSEVNWSITDVK